MLTKIRQKLTMLGVLAAMLLPAALPVMSPQVAFAASTNARQAACDGIGLTGADCGSGDAGTKLTSVIKTVVNLLAWMVGVAAVIMIILAGFKYITSGGDSAKVSSAKNTMVYALVGMVVAVLAQFLVHFVLDKFS